MYFCEHWNALCNGKKPDINFSWIYGTYNKATHNKLCSKKENCIVYNNIIHWDLYKTWQLNLLKALVSLKWLSEKKDRGFLIYLPRNFFGGLIGSPASGQTTHLSSTKLNIKYNEWIIIYAIIYTTALNTTNLFIIHPRDNYNNTVITTVQYIIP